jgi:hypothetical protein
MRTPIRTAALLLLLNAGAALAAEPRRFEVSAFASWLRFSEFEEGDFGFGVRGGFRLNRAFALELEAEHFPSELGGRIPFSTSRSAAGLRARAGWNGEKWGLFARLGPGLASFGEAPEPLLCLAVFPPPLTCQIGAGLTVPGVAFGGGLELRPGDRSVVRLDVEDSMLHYPEAFRRDHRWQHHLRASLGLGLRF